jgi:hypothetical protein
MIDNKTLEAVRELAEFETPGWASRQAMLDASGVLQNVDVGAFPLTGVQQLPNISVAFPGEHWSDGKASEAIAPGELVVPVNNGGKRYWARAAAGAVDPRSAVAMNVVQSPDGATGSIYTQPLGPNEIVNRVIPVDQYVHAYRSGAFHLTLVVPDATYGPGDLIQWDPAGARPTGKGGVGSWKKLGADAVANAFFEVEEWRPYNAAKTEGILTVRSLRGQF